MKDSDYEFNFLDRVQRYTKFAKQVPTIKKILILYLVNFSFDWLKGCFVTQLKSKKNVTKYNSLSLSSFVFFSLEISKGYCISHIIHLDHPVKNIHEQCLTTFKSCMPLLKPYRYMYIYSIIKTHCSAAELKKVTKSVCFVMFIAYYNDSVNCTFEKRSALIKKKETQTS